MELVRGTHNLGQNHVGCVLTIGNFDGVHLGHQALLRQLRRKAQQLSLPSVVMSFEPQPLEYFRGDQAPARLTTLRDKCRVLAELEIDRLVCLHFDRHFAAMSAEAFIEQLLVQRLGVRFLVIGDDFRFGAGRRGDFNLLRQAGERHGFEVVNTDSFCVQQQRISSTLIRDALAAGKLEQVAEWLGRRYSICGRVVHGDKLGRTIGFPTANVLLKRQVSPVSGVFAVRVHGSTPGPVVGVANIGQRPTVHGVRTQLEVHLFDFDGDLYGQVIEVELIRKLRDEQRFDSFELLRQQIQQDVQQARALFAAAPERHAI